jgi:hypothetical protein
MSESRELEETQVPRATTVLPNVDDAKPIDPSDTGDTIIFGVLPSIMLVVGVVVYHLFKRKQR